MNALLDHVVLAASTLRLLPHLLVLVFSGNRACIDADLLRWDRQCFGRGHLHSEFGSFFKLMTRFPEYRNLFYFRSGAIGKLLRPLCRPVSTLFIETRSIGPGLFIQHGFATIIAARSIGANCWINQQVTIGYANADEAPTLGANVTVGAGAKIIGGLHVGDDVRIGANCVVVKDVPPGVTVVGVPARIVRRDGTRVGQAA